MTQTQNYDNILLCTPILSADPNAKEDVINCGVKPTRLRVG